MRLFQNIQIYGWAVLPQARPSSLHGVEKPFRLDVMQPIENIQVYGWAALPNIPCHGPAHFAELKNRFVLMLCRLSTTLEWTASPAPPITVQLISRCWKGFSSWWYEAFQKHSNQKLGRAPPNTAQFLSRCWKTFSSECYAANYSHSSLWPGRAPQHPLSRPSSFRELDVLPETRSSSFQGVEQVFRFDGMKPFKNIRTCGWAVLPQTRPTCFYGVDKSFRLDVMQLLENIQIYGETALPNISCHGPAHFTALKNLFVLMLCRLSTTFKWTACSAILTLSSTIHGVEKIVFLDGMKLFQNSQMYGWAVLPQARPSFFHGVENFFFWMLCSHSKTFKFVAGPCSPTSPVTVQLISRL